MIHSTTQYMPHSHKPSSPEFIQLRTAFAATRDQLLNGSNSAQLEKPLAYWALPNDRGLPFALLTQRVHDVLAAPFDSLAATPGIGPKKLKTLLTLLERIALEDRGSAAHPVETADEAKPVAPPSSTAASFDPSAVSEAQWRQWCDAIVKSNFESEMLGRLAPSLQVIPSRLWRKTLGEYAHHSLSEIRRLKNHGAKRVQAILSIFSEVNRFTSLCDQRSYMTVRLVPKHITLAGNGLAALLADRNLMTTSEIRTRVVAPLAEQVKIDLGSKAYSVVQSRLGINASPLSINSLTRKLGLTPARIYQYYESVTIVMSVRWPEGHDELSRVCKIAESQPADPAVVTLLNEMHDLFFA